MKKKIGSLFMRIGFLFLFILVSREKKCNFVQKKNKIFCNKGVKSLVCTDRRALVIVLTIK